MPVEISGGTLSGGTTAGGGGDTGGYDILGTGAVGDPTRGGVTLADISGGDSSDDAYVAAIQANVDRQLAQQAIQRLQQAGLPQQVKQGFAVGTSPYAQLSARMNLNQLPFFGGIGRRTASGIMERIQAGGIPVYDARTGDIVGVRVRSDIGDKAMGFLGEKLGFEPEPQYTYFGRPNYSIGEENAIKDQFGNIIGYESPLDISTSDDDGGYIAPEATTVAAVEPEPEVSMIEQGYRYPAGGYYPQEGRFLRQGLLDVAPTIYGGLLAGYDPTQFGAMNVGFRQPTDVSLYQDPYDVSGYALI